MKFISGNFVLKKIIELLIVITVFHIGFSIKASTNILVIYPERMNRPIIRSTDHRIESTFEHLFPEPPKVYTEFMDTIEFGATTHLSLLQDYLSKKYQTEKIDVVLAIGNSLPFALELCNSSFPRAKLIYSTLDSDSRTITSNSNLVTGVTIRTDFSPTLELARQLQPALEEVVCIVDRKVIDFSILRTVSEKLSQGPRPLRLQILYHETPEQTKQEIQKLKPNQAIFIHWLRDGRESNASAAAVAEMVATHSPVPSYCLFDEYLELGFLAGGQVNVSNATYEAVQLAADWIKTKRKPPAIFHDGVPTVNIAQLKRWGLSRKALPDEVKILEDEPSWWQQHLNFLLSAACICLVQTGWIWLLLKSKSAQAKAEQQLQTQIHYIDLAAKSSGLGMWTWDTEKKTLWVSDLARTHANIPLDTEISIKNYIKCIHQEDRIRVVQSLRRLRSQGENIDVEFRVLGSDGIRWLRMFGGVIRWQAEDPSALAGTIQDVTQQKKAKRKLSEEWSKVVHRNRVGLMGEMAASLAHEISQPIGSMINNATVARRLIAKGNTEHLEELLEDIELGGKHAKEIIQSVRAMARNQGSSKETLNINNVIADALRLVRKDIANRGCILKMRLTPDLPKILADRVQIQQVIVNLVINALDAMETNEEDKRRLDVLSQFHDEKSVRILVRDYGKGVDEKAKRRLFDRFYTTKTNGMGMGLSIARTIIENHQGSLELLDDFSPGACFAIILPILTEVEEKTEPLQFTATS